MKPGTRMFMEWAHAATARLVGVLEPLPAPRLVTEGVGGGVALSWEEIPNVGVYLCFEAENVGEIDFPFAVVRSKGTGFNGTVRSGAEDTNTRFYYVQAVSPLGVLGNLSDAVEGAAGSAINLTGLDDLLLPMSIQFFREDFLSASSTSTQIGWLGMNAGGTGGQGFIDGVFPYTGIFRIGATTNGAEQGIALTADPAASTLAEGLGKVWNNPGASYSNLDPILPFDSLSGWHVIVIFRLPDGPSVVDFNIGFLSQGSFTSATGSQDCFGIRQRASVGAFEIFQHKGHGQATQLPPTLHNLQWKDTLTPAAITDSNWHRLDLISFNGPQQVSRHGSIYLHCYIDGREMGEDFFDGTAWIADTGAGDSGALTRNMSFGITMVKREVGATIRNMDIDYVAMQFTRQQPLVAPSMPRFFAEAPTAP